MTWRAVYCISGQEALAAKELTSLGVKVFFPYERFKRHKKVLGTTQVRWINQALFPGYLFAQADYLDLTTVRGAISIVRSGLNALSIPGPVIAALQALADPSGLIRSEDLTKNSSKFKSQPDDMVEFKSGPLAGLLGKISSLARLDETGEVLAWVNLLGGTTRVSAHFSDLKPQAA